MTKNHDSSVGVTDIDFKDLFESIPIPAIVFDRQVRIVFTNSAFRNAMGGGPEKLSGGKLEELFPDTSERVDPFRDAFIRALDGETTELNAQPYRYVDGNGEPGIRYWRVVQAPYFDSKGNITHVIQIAQDVSKQVSAERRNEVITRELDHRVKNLMTVVNGITRLSLEKSKSLHSFANSLLARFEAMARNYARLSRGDWGGMDVRKILTEELELLLGSAKNQVQLSGPTIELTIEATKDIGLVVHELLTNALKYGCFSQESGRLDVSWKLSDDKFRLVWAESGLTNIREPNKEGFGTTLLSNLTTLRARATYFPQGVLYEIEADLVDFISET